MPEQVLDIEANTLQEARNIIRSKMPQGYYLLSEKILSDGQPKSVRGIGETIEIACANAQNRVPNEAEIIDTKELTVPHQSTITVEAFDEQSAENQARQQIAEDATVKMIQVVTHGKKGFWGIGRKPNTYEVSVFHPGKVEIAYRTKARLSAKISNEEKLWPSVGDKGYCQMCGKPDVSFQLVGNRAVFLCSKQCENRYGPLRVAALQHKNVNIIVNVSGRSIDPILEERRKAYESPAYCWFCGSVITMGIDKCPACKREPDPKLPE